MSESSPAEETVAAGRAALSRGAWPLARRCFEESLARAETPAALEGLAWAAWWLEDVPTCLNARERAYRAYRSTGDARSAARTALWLGDDHLEFRGAAAVADGWFRRAARLLEELEPAPEHGWLTVFDAHAALNRHNPAEARRLAAEARAQGRRHAAVDLEMFSLATEGMAMVEQGEVEQGLRFLDEATTAALAGEYENLVPAAWTCCRVLSVCEQLRDYDRGAQWCAAVADFSRRTGCRFVTGVCRAHYAAILAWHGGWDEAERELLDARRNLTATRPSWLAEAVVRLGDLRRRQGRRAEAEELFAQAAGHPLAQLGLAELELDRDDARTARELLERILRRTPPASRMSRVGPLELLIRAEVALGERSSAEIRFEELRAVAAAVPTRPLRAAVRFSEGLLAAAADDHERACDCFEDAVDLYRDSGATLETRRARLELTGSLLARGLAGAAQREARTALEQPPTTGANADDERTRVLLERLGMDLTAASRRSCGPLSARQVQVLRLVAEGLGDRDIARRLVLSEHTVHRHIANIYRRLGCSTRAAAVARAGRLGLL